MNKRFGIVTGGAKGIGRSITEKFITSGCFVAVIDMDKQAGERLREQFGEDKLLFFHGDIAEKEALEQFAQMISTCTEKVDFLIHNACVNRGGLQSCGYEDFMYVFQTGVAAPFYLTKLLQPCFHNSSVVNIASTRAFMSQPDTESYTAAKGGIAALTHAMSISLAGKARVNAISPGWIDTAEEQPNAAIEGFSPPDRLQQPVGRIGKPEDIAEMAFYLCSDQAGFITGENIVIDGGMTRQMIYHGEYGWKLEK